MNIQNVHNADSWMHFMKIVEEARARTASPAAAAAKKAFAPAVRDIRPTSATMPGILRTPEPPKMHPKTVGGFFDAYA